MAYPLGTGELSTLRTRMHWHCDLYKIARRDGGPAVRVSTLDTLVTYRREVYRPTAGEKYDAKADGNFSAGETELVGVIGANTMTLVDVQRGVFDDARIDQYVYDWRRGKVYRHMVWWIDEVLQDGKLWRAQLSTMGRFLEATRGTAYHTTCGAIFGDTRCKKVVTPSAGTVTAITDSLSEFSSAVTAAVNYFALGFVEWKTGNNRGKRSRVHAFASGGFKLSEPTRFAIRVGDTFEATPGCDGRATTCKDTHANLENFRGNERQGNAKQLILARGVIE